MKLERVRAIATRELLAIRRSRPVWLPMLLLPLILFVLLPTGLLAAVRLTDTESLARQLAENAAKLPSGVLDGLPLEQPRLALVLLGLRMLAPLFVLIPVMTASVVAADAFAGERERRTLEPILHSPVTDLELFVGKCLGAFLPALASSVGGLLVVSLVIDAGTWTLAPGLPLPNGLWLAFALSLAPALAGLAVALTVLVSARVRGFQEANQASVLLVLPVVGLTAGQATGALLLSPWMVLLAGLVVFALDAAIVVLAARRFNRERLFGRMGS